jgi:hypothetical protein
MILDDLCRNKFILLLIFGLITQSVYSQTAPCPVIGIKTDPTPGVAVNPEVPSKTNTFFDWRIPYYNTNTTTLLLNPTIASPFSQEGNTNVQAFLENPDMQSYDGWELISYDMGFNEDGSPKIQKPAYVHLILYNKYSGVMRVFLAGGAINGYNGARIKITFATGMPLYSSLLSNGSKLFPLSTFEPNPEIQSVTRYLNGEGYWFYGDFQMTYDPCTCITESTVKVLVEMLSQAEIELTGSFTGTISTIQPGQGSVNDSGFSFKDLTAAGEKAHKSYKTMNDFVKDQERAFEIEGKTDAEIEFEKGIDFLTKKHELNKFQEFIKDRDVLKSGLKMVPYVGAAVELVSFFSSGSKKGPSTVALMPMAINATIDLKGTLTVANPYKDIFFYTPGSKNVATKDPRYYPYYNEVLGVANLLTLPKLNRKYLSSAEAYIYQLDGPFEFVINPAAGFKLDENEILGNITFFGKRDSRVDSDTRKLDTVTVTTGYMPSTQLSQFASHVWDNTIFDPYSYGYYDRQFTWYKAEVKFLVRLIRTHDAAEASDALIVLTYPLEIVANNSFAYSSVEAKLTGNDFREYYNSTDYTGTIENKVIAEWNKSIFVKPNSRIKPNTTIKMVSSPFVEANAFQPLATSTRINEFCQNQYRNTPTRSMVSGRIPDSSEEDNAVEEIDEYVYVYPNPTEGNVTFEIQLRNSQKDLQIVLMDIMGNTAITLYEGPYEKRLNFSLSRDLSALPPGVYFYSVMSNWGIHKRDKIVIR